MRKPFLQILLALGILLVPGIGFAESGGILGKGANVYYAGVGVQTFSKLTRDGWATPWNLGDAAGVNLSQGALFSQIDLYYARGLPGGMQLALHVPLRHYRVVDDGSNNCNQDEGTFCEAVTGIGEFNLELRKGFMLGNTKWSVGLGGGTGVWNEKTRLKFTNISEATSRVAGGIYGSIPMGAMQLTLFGVQNFYFGLEDTTFGNVPKPTLNSGVEVYKGLNEKWGMTAGLYYLQRFGGATVLEYRQEPSWSSGRWSAAAYAHVALGAEFFYKLGGGDTLILGLSRVLAAANGPPDATLVKIGIGRYQAP